MRTRKQNLAMLFVLMFIAVLALVAPHSYRQATMAAGAAAQNPNRSDVPTKPKVKRQKQGPSVPTVAPANDNCANAISINACPFTDTKDTTQATDEAGEPTSTCTAQGNSIWYTLPPAANARSITVDTCASAPVDTALMVYEVTGAACAFAGFVPVTCNDDFCGDGLQSSTNFVAFAGKTYKIQVGGFAGDTGPITTNVACVDFACDPTVVNGQLGLGSPDYPSVSGQQTPARLFRDGIPSTCAAPKACPGPFSSGSFTFDAYTFQNESNATQCVTVAYKPNIGCNVNAHAIVYLNSFSPTNLCLNYLADVGSSDDLSFSFNVPAGLNFVVVIAANNPGGVGNGCAYQFTVVGEICEQFDFCVQDDKIPGRFIKINSTTGAYEFHDCSKNITLAGTGTAGIFFCKVTVSDGGGNPPNRAVSVALNPCTGFGNAQVRLPGAPKAISISDSNIFNNTCACP